VLLVASAWCKAPGPLVASAALSLITTGFAEAAKRPASGLAGDRLGGFAAGQVLAGRWSSSPAGGPCFW
jgi:hypothetical protein